MTSEEIIQRLLDEKKITVAESLIILKDLAKIGINRIIPIEKEQEIPNRWTYPITVMYGITPSYTNSLDTSDICTKNKSYLCNTNLD